MKRIYLEVVIDVDDYAAQHELDDIKEAIQKVLNRHDGVRGSKVSEVIDLAADEGW